MEKPGLKQKGATKLIIIDENTWIETSIDVPDHVAREKFLKKWVSCINAPNRKVSQQVQPR